MKTLERSKAISISLISIGAIIISTLPTLSIAQVPAKRVHMAGRVTSTSANTIRSGKGAPINEVGVDGDFYIDTLKLNFYGPKASGHWPPPVSLRGPAGVTGVAGKPGANGIDGKAGVNGEKGISASSSGTIGLQGLQGLQGVQGVQGVPGPIGGTGLTGVAGPTGPIGSAGLTGTNGVQGLPGTPGATGSNGATGLTGPIGATGLTGVAGATGVAGSIGATGSQGTQGIQGTAGPSQVQVTPINSWILSTTTAGTGNTSSSFGTLETSKTYEFMLSINGQLASPQSPSYAIKVGLNIRSSDPSAVITYAVSSSFGYSNDGDANTYSKESFIAIGTIAMSSANPTSTLSVTAIDSGPSTGTDVMTLSGTAFIQLVGSLA